MQAVILAAGMGKRLGELTKNNTKCMVKINGISLINRLLEQLSKLSLNKIIIVIGYEGEKLKNYLGYSYKTIEIEYIENPIYNKTNNIYSLYLAKEKLLEDDTILIESDLIFEDSIFTLLEQSSYPNVAVVAKYESWMDGTMVRIDNENNIINFIPKKAFRYEDIALYYKTVNIYKFSKEFARNQYIPFLEAYIHALGNNEYYEQVLRVITILDNCNLKALILNNEKWYEIDDIQDLDIAETIFSNDNERLSKYQQRYGGYWRFPGLLDFCYLVNPFFPPQKMKDELRSNFDRLLMEYPSGMKINSLLIAKYFNIKQNYVCVGNGAAELIKSLMSQLNGKIGIISPTFEEYPNRKSTNDIITFYPQNKNFSYEIKELQTFYENKNISSLLIVNPDNPSGNFIPPKELLTLAQWTKNKNIQLIIDESFVDFSDASTNNTLLQDNILEEFTNLIVIKSISKSYGVPGIRLGVIASADTNLINFIKKDVSIWNINSFGEYYMQIFGKYESDYKLACQKFIQERERFYQQLTKISYLRIIPSQANYFLCEVYSPYTSRSITELLLNKYNILIKDCSNKKGFNHKNYIRIAVRSKFDNDQLVSALNHLSPKL
ncbi:aminotransferase class I/II-fold pyridoxal phosphate-dependent enzyme [Phocaeicola plebeius]|jgi:histidinol-phosphate/aromatic aminotransferase/cobyric acid decarboxylase-like protein/choline kinase|uniref:Aminotransferase n=1 Tax=Phocaeicola plebeius TaxID=310297 RepID=A0A414G0U8_9BACT|nr:aminotransferase class I/II-fold pyridoxal phosphate-dependent enzyme [Phocaeicola plebeius]RHD57785.1 aminotransferase class I/II-fold pyridoxal phosphate-dependent enzyme [Phocaeicola plebeius]